MEMKPRPPAQALGQPLRLALALAPVLVAIGWALLSAPTLAMAVIVVGGAAQITLVTLLCVRLVAPWERAVILRHGEPVAARGPGLVLVRPFVDVVQVVDLRLRALGLERRRLVTLDHKPVWVEAALFYAIEDPTRALLASSNLDEALVRLAQASLHSVASRMLLKTLQTRIQHVENELESEALQRAADWGVRFDRFRLLAVEPVYLLSTQAEPSTYEENVPTAERLREGDIPVEVIHGTEALRHDSPGEVVCFPADVGRNLPRLSEKLPD